MSDIFTLDELLLVEPSRRNSELLAEIIFQKPGLFEEVFRLYQRNLELLSLRAAWVIDIASERHPDLIAPYLPEIIAMLQGFRNDGLKRHSMRILSRSPLPADSQLGELIKISFEWLVSPVETVSTKVYCMEILYRISQLEPDLKKELADSIEWRMHEETPGFKNRGQKILKKLYHEIG
jgi:hypothetical protein